MHIFHSNFRSEIQASLEQPAIWPSPLRLWSVGRANGIGTKLYEPNRTVIKLLSTTDFVDSACFVPDWLDSVCCFSPLVHPSLPILIAFQFSSNFLIVRLQSLCLKEHLWLFPSEAHVEVSEGQSILLSKSLKTWASKCFCIVPILSIRGNTFPKFSRNVSIFFKIAKIPCHKSTPKDVDQNRALRRRWEQPLETEKYMCCTI